MCALRRRMCVIVSLLVRLWVEMILLKSGITSPGVSLLVRLWVEICWRNRFDWRCNVSLLVRLWVEIHQNLWLKVLYRRQPPREAVSWNIREAEKMSARISQPPREAVSWNDKINALDSNRRRSASSWGCELKCCVIINDAVWIVSLLVRLWVEMILWNRGDRMAIVSLLVRLWVEIAFTVSIPSTICRQPPREAVSWNSISDVDYPVSHRQPPREAVSWNFHSRTFFSDFQLSASSWGCELKCTGLVIQSINRSQPPREAVSWNLSICFKAPYAFSSASSWGCELKYHYTYQLVFCNGSASSWGCELKYVKNYRRFAWMVSASSWGCELK